IFYTYNIRNWISSIRANIFEQYSNPVSFEENIFYDYGFKSKLYNGTIAGITWQGNGSTAPKRFYGYSYDPLGRLTHAEFREKVGSGAYNKNDNDFTVSNIAYDLNGNIKQMRQRGTDPAGSGPIDMDILSYTYKENSNQLASITDDGENNTTLPDFKNLVNDSNEYVFDDNGNLVYDGNKEITNVSYNYLNKPSKIEISGKGIVTFVYDAAGNKLQKKVYDQQQAKTTIYDYIENFTYQDNVLQFIANDEGRCKPYLVSPNGGFGLPQNFKIGFNYESFVKDHLGNVRQVVSSESVIRQYFASHEIASANVEQLVFENIDLVRDEKPGSTNPDDQMAAHLIAEDPEKRIGTAIMLRVVPGDEFEISADGYYNAEYKEQETLSGEEVIASLINTLNGGITYSGVPISELPENARIINETLNNSSLPQLLEQINNSNESPTAPQAHLNYLSFDDKMTLIPENSGRVQIQEATTGWNTISPEGKISIKEPGYIVVYLSNRSVGTAVYFDRLRMNLVRGKVREDNHYYPFGLTLDLLNAGNPPNDKNEIKFQSQKHENDLGLNLYSFRFREHDPQIGRFWQTDPLSESFSYNSPYAFSENKVTSHIELEGLETFFLGQVPPSIWTRPATIILEENPPVVRPVVEQVAEGTAKTGRFSAEQLKNFERGRTVEAEQLAKNGYEKNTKPFDVEVTPGKNTRTIPDALKNEGKSTVEVKNVSKQSYTRQLKAQEKISNDNGFKPELIINKDAQISKPLQNSSFDIKLYTPPPGGVIDNTGHKVQDLRPVKVDPFDYFNQLM
ncbi:MAG TPA: putative toxin, partial [Pseudosphingobacterium sp.]|nr:putative toxin [Pseudosphingobacterium sp.]